MKKVLIALQVDSEFLVGLRTNITLSQARKARDPVNILACAIFAEASGGLIEEVKATIPDEWKDHISIVHDARNVIDVPEDKELDQEASLLQELTWRTVIEASHLEASGQAAAAERLVKKGKLKKGTMKAPGSGDRIPVYKIPKKK